MLFYDSCFVFVLYGNKRDCFVLYEQLNYAWVPIHCRINNDMMIDCNVVKTDTMK